MFDPYVSRRNFGLGVAGAAAFLATGAARAQTTGPAAGDAGSGSPELQESANWMDVVKQHHLQIEETFQDILKTSDQDASSREKLLKQLNGILTAHSVAEENVLYPAMSMVGMEGYDGLYDEQSAAKVMLAKLHMDAKDQSGWLDTVRQLHEAIKAHVAEEEESFPQLMEKLGDKNTRINADFQREYGRVNQNA